MVKYPHYHRDKRRAMHALFEPLDPKSGAEIGVWNGKTSRSLLKRFPDLTLCMVDRWTPPPEGDSWLTSGDRFALRSQEEHDEAYRCAMLSTSLYRDRRRVIHMPSVMAASLVESESLDFVFIDGDHSFSGTLNDIKAWWWTVRSGGLISGHDYSVGEALGYGVAKAVREFFGRVDLEFEILAETFIWHARKP